LINDYPDQICRVTDVSARHLTITLNANMVNRLATQDSTSFTHSNAHLINMAFPA